jgi:NADPH-dependent 2,4-dienoyl-CoA reductase/sulfur reductase-like enzyme
MTTRRLQLHIDGRLVQVPAGITVAAALRHAGDGVTRLSVHGAPRAPVCGMGVCQECRVQVDQRRVLACQTLCADGMVVDTGGKGGAEVGSGTRALADQPAGGAAANAANVAGATQAQRALPHAEARPAPHAPPRPGQLAQLRGAVHQLFGGPSVPRLASAPPTTCDVLIVGAGPAGLAAALAAAPNGAAIVILDDNPAPGGQIWRDGPGVRLPATARRLREAVARCANVRICSGTRVVAASAPHALLLEDAQQGWVLQWRQLILCTGARELLLPFPGWTLPGVTGAGGLQALIKGGMPVAGERIVVAGSGPLLLAAAATARRAGAQVLRVAEQAPWHAVAGFALQLARWPGKAAQALALMDAHYRTGQWVVAAQGTRAVASVRLRAHDGREHEIPCDRLACGFGLVPNTELARLLGCKTGAHGDALGVEVNARQATSLADVYAAGECTGIGGGERALLQGAIAGHAAVGDAAGAARVQAGLARWTRFAALLQRQFALAPALRQLAKAETLVCRCEDVAIGEVAPRAGWVDAKLHTRCGMGACQGRVCGAAAQALWGWAPPAPRPPLSPVRLGTLTKQSDDGAGSAGIPSERP